MPLLMVAWVNLHLGFIAGLALVVAYVAAEIGRCWRGPDAARARERLKAASAWLLLCLLATLVNPWGWGLYKALARQEGIMGLHSERITEWASTPLTIPAIMRALQVRQPNGAFFLLLGITFVAVALVVVRKQAPAAVLLSGAAWLGVRHLRFQALFACVVVIVASPALASAAKRLAAQVKDERLRSIFAAGAVASVLLLVTVRSADLITNRYYFGTSGEPRSFGAGLSWWFPKGAAEFVARERPPGRIFNSYNEGGYLVWELGPAYPDYIDGRAVPFGPDTFKRSRRLMQSSPDGPDWQHEAETYNINTAVFSLSRYEGLELFPALPQFCDSVAWKPVYLDENSAVFVRKTAETEPLIARSGLSCTTAPLPRSLSADPDKAFNQWANAAAVLYFLGRDQEAFNAATNALRIFPASITSRVIRGRLLVKAGRSDKAEAEFLAATRDEPNATAWMSLARIYRSKGQLDAAIRAMMQAIQASPRPCSELLSLGNLYLEARAPKQALESFENARRCLPDDAQGAVLASVAQARARAWRDLGEVNRAVQEQEEAVRLAPMPQQWLQLADLYELQHRPDDAQRARAQAASGGTP